MIVLSNILCANDFTYDIQRAGYAFDQYDSLGEAKLQIFLDEFRTYPWEIEVRNVRQGTSAPTIAVRNSTTQTDLWVSAGETDDTLVPLAYLVGVIYPTENQNSNERWLKIFVLEDPDTVERMFQIFFDNDYHLLLSELGNYYEFVSMVAPE